MAAEPQKLFRNTQAGVVAGICAGLAEYFKVETVGVRLVFVLSVFLGLSKIGFIIPILYIILWIILPVKPYRLFPDVKENPPIPHFSDPPDFEQHPEISTTPPVVSRKPILGIILLGLGIILLLIQLDYMNFRELGKYWPILIIALGISIIVASFKKRKTGLPEVDRELKEEENGN